MKAVILAGGKGARLQPYTTVFPKPLVPVGERPILDIILRQLIHYGFTDIHLAVGYLSGLIQTYFANCLALDDSLELSYHIEKEPLGTAGAIALIPGLDETFLVMNGDILTDLDFRELLSFHREKKPALTIAMYAKPINFDLGIMEVDEASGELIAYREKPTQEIQVSMGIYVYEPRALDYITKGEHLDFPQLVHRLIDDGERVLGFPFRGYWRDIGRREDYEKVLGELEDLGRLLPGEDLEQ